MKKAIVSSFISLAVFTVFAQCAGTKTSDTLSNKNTELNKQQIQDTTRQETKQNKVDSVSNNKNIDSNLQSAAIKQNKETRQLIQNNDTLNTQIQKLTQDTVKLNKQIQKLAQDTIKLNKKIKQLIQNNDTLNIQIQKLTQDTVKLNKQIQQLAQDTIKLNKKIKQLIQNNDTLNIQIQKLAQDTIKLNKKIQEVIKDYKIKSFDELINSSNKFSIQQAKRIVDNKTEENEILSNLEIYFETKELLNKKFDPTKINNALEKLNKIKQQSSKLKIHIDQLKEYKDFNDELKEAMKKIIDLDSKMIAAGAPKAQEAKLKDILSILGNYIYNNSDYINYPYLSDIIREIIKRKYQNADDTVKDLLQKL